MKKSVLPWAGVLVVSVLFLALCIEAKDTGEILEHRSDLITIDTLKSFDTLERPEVIFLHDLHTEALEKNNKDCRTCHLSEKSSKDRLSFKFKRLEDTDKKQVMDIYHAECMGCHKGMSASGQTSGPIEVCGQCHKENKRLISSRLPMAFDKSLHFRHTETNKDEKTNKGNCALCHHEYDETEKKLFYAKDKEGSCRYCHMKETQDNRMSISLAAHSGCIDCHKNAVAEKKKTGPIKCAGCHDAKMQQEVEKIAEVPRLERKQPDVVLIQANNQKTNEDDRMSGMNPVPFDHKAHEGYNDTCRVCHHASLDSCSKKCHTPTGSKEGNYVNFESAMHQKGNKKSCIGCHEMNKNQPNCAACHSLNAGNPMIETSCKICHMKPLPKNSPATPMDKKLMAEMLLKSRKAASDTYKDEDIPEKVIIKKLAEEYEPVEFPHGKIINTLLNNIKDNTLAGYFHAEKGTVCRSCHHNSPLDPKPPRCGSCHGEPFDQGNIFRPGIKGAYHQQCNRCHQELNIEKPTSTGCTDCHKMKKK
jgi:hypothetical protein